jgi:hypothetical protein
MGRTAIELAELEEGLVRWMDSGENVLDDGSADISEAVIASGVAEGALFVVEFVVEAEEAEDGSTPRGQRRTFDTLGHVMSTRHERDGKQLPVD